MTRTLCKDEAEFDARCASRGASYAAAIARAVVSHEDGQVCMDVDHDGWHQAEAIAAGGRPKGVGDHLHDAIVQWFGVHPDGGCGCESAIVQLNRWGPEGCVSHFDEIVEHLMGQREQLGGVARRAIRIPGAERVARWHLAGLLTHAIKLADQEQDE